jgi:MYXO-CTERM domain-containing protein
MTVRRTPRTLPATLGLCTLFAATALTDPASAYTRIRTHSPQPAAGGTCAVSYGTITDTVTYQGGPVISNAQTVPVFWTSGIDPTVAAWAEGYLATLVDSAYFDLLAQYSTVGQAGGTGQTIGHGTAVAPLTITPISATGTKIADKAIGPEIQAQITAGHLPAPTLDAKGNTNTIYVLFFPQSITITYGGGTSCKDFCGYHGSSGGTAGNPSFEYAVIPDMGAGSGCATGCSDECLTADTDVMAGTVSHEVAESVTDPADAPGWVNPNQSSQNYEIGDICVGNDPTQQDTGIVPGTTILAQYDWSQRDLKCLLANPDADGGVPEAGGSSGGVDSGSSSGGQDAGGSGSGSSSGSSSGSGSGSSSGTGSGSSSGSSSGVSGPDAGHDAGEANADTGGGKSGGCGCRVTGERPDAGVGLGALAGLAVLVAARRDRRRRRV